MLHLMTSLLTFTSPTLPATTRSRAGVVALYDTSWRRSFDGRGTGVQKPVAKKIDKASPMLIAQFLAAPEVHDAALKDAPREKLIEILKADEAVTDAAISMAITAVLPFLPGQETPGVPSIVAAEAAGAPGAADEVSPMLIAQFLAAPEVHDAALKDAPREKLI